MANIETRISRLEMCGEGGSRVIVVTGSGEGCETLLADKGILARSHDLVIAISKPAGFEPWVSVDGVRCA